MHVIECTTLNVDNKYYIEVETDLLLQLLFPAMVEFTEDPSITDRVHRNENYVEIIPVFSTFSNFFKKKKIYI